MSRMWRKGRKFFNLALANASSYFRGTPAFVRVIPTDRCNQRCAYCWQRDQASGDMPLDEFKACLEHAARLRVGLMTFLGGEPLLWEPLPEAIAACTRRHILTDITTNGSLLDQEMLERLGRAGLDYLNISVDGAEVSEVSAKNAVFQNGLMETLKRTKRRYGVHFRLNAVIYRNNFSAICDLLEFVREHGVQLSLGFVVPHLGPAGSGNEAICFTSNDEPALREIVGYVLAKKREGYPVIDPDAYFTGVFRFLRGEHFWDCNYPTRYGWVNVTPRGKVRSCTKAMDELDVRFVDLDRQKVAELRRLYAEKTARCNVHCYSNCAYDSYYYTHHKLEMARRIVARLLIRPTPSLRPPATSL